MLKAKTKKKRVRLDAALRREKILDEAILLVGRRGYHGFSIQELAQRCKLTNAGLLYYFGTKERLLIDLLESRDRRDAAAVSSMVGLKPEDGGRTTLTFEKTMEVLHAIVARNCTQPEIVRLYAVLQGEALDSAHPAYDYFVAREAKVMDALTKMLAPHVARPRSMIRHLLGLLNGLEQQWLRANMAFDLVAEWDSAVAALLPRPKPGRQTRGPPSSD